MSLPSVIPVSVSELTGLLVERLGLVSSPTDFWITAELDNHIRNAVREFQVLTGYWRARGTLTTSTGVPFYDLHTALVPRSTLDTDVLAQAGYHLLEYSGAGAYVHTGQFSVANIAAAFGEWIDRVLGETRMVLYDYEGTSGIPSGRFTLDPSIVQVHRVEWKDTASGLWTLLDRTDDIGAYGWASGWSGAAGLPRAFSQSTTPPLTIDLVPAPVAAGSFSALVTYSQGYAYVASVPAALLTPDDALWALVWGTLAGVLRQDAQSRDSARADYAARRAEAALAVLKSWPCALQAFPSGAQQPLSSLFNLDHWSAGWRNALHGAPQTVTVAGRNLLSVAPVPDGAYAISLDLVGNSPASVSNRSTAFACANDIVSALLDHAQHEACFKMGGDEFMGTMPLYRSFLDVARAYASRERANDIDWEQLKGVTALESAQAPYERVSEESPA